MESETSGESAPLEVSTDVLAQFNRGAALMEQYEYSKAAEAFSDVLQKEPDWVAARFNFGLANLNKDTEKSREVAVEAFRAVLDADPGNLHALFCLGMYYQHMGDPERALVCFARVHWGDPEDPHVAFKFAETLIDMQREEQGVEVLEKVVEMDPGFISALYRLGLQYRRSRGDEKAQELLARFQKLHAAEVAGGAYAVQKVYGTVGKYYTVLGADDHPLIRDPDTASRRIVFSPDVERLDRPTRAWDWNGGAIGMPGIAVADVDRDGDLDLFLTATRENGGGTIWLNDGTGEFTPAETIDHPCVSAAFGDVDNDGNEDLWLGCAGGAGLMKNDGEGTFALADYSDDASAGGASPDTLTPVSRLLDIDSDGDLDLLAFRVSAGSVPAGSSGSPAASSIYRNNRDGSYTELAETLGLKLSDVPIAAVVCDDLDGDGDVDMVIFPAGDREPIVWANDRQGAFRILDPADVGLSSCTGVVSATTGDWDKNGDRDLLVFMGKSMALYENAGGFRFQRRQRFNRRHENLGGTGGQFVDMDNDGDLDLLLGDAHRRDGTRGPVLLVNQWPEPEFVNLVELDPGNLLSAIDTEGDASCVAADFTGNGQCDVLIAAMGQKPSLVRNVTQGGHWIQLDLRGKRGRDKKTRSNNSAIGARVEIKTSSVYQQYVVGGTSGPVAAPPLRVHAGLDDYPKVDWLRIVWPDAVLQSELEIAGGQVKTITEQSRKTSSCPYLYAWDGDRFQFVSDFGGVGGLGYLVAPDTYAPPDPTEYVPVPELAPRDGYYELNALTVLEEVTYFDEAKLIAVDHPTGTTVFPNEMMAINVPPPEFKVFCFRDPIEPRAARDHRDVDVTDKLSAVDRRYAGATDLDTRFAGIAEPHFVELDFGDRLSDVAPDDQLILVANGWVEYGYSSTNYAAWQAGLRPEAPSIEVLRDGQWVEILDEVGYPAGIQHVMTLDVSGKVLPTDQVLRISSNMELYWDQIHLAVHQVEERLRLKEVPAASADLHFFGFPREYSPDGRHPNLSDYANVDRGGTWKLMSGDYTRFGDVTELVTEPDDCFVIMGHGEELTLKFPVEAFGPVPEGHQRSFILKTDSFCKDMDLYTAYPDTVEPLPFHAMSGYPYGADEHYPTDQKHTEYRRRYNTRRVRVRSE
ncbi:MAG: FG-GAP-like repeat-containing protein [Pirellulaceae bacterium]